MVGEKNGEQARQKSKGWEGVKDDVESTKRKTVSLAIQDEDESPSSLVSRQMESITSGDFKGMRWYINISLTLQQSVTYFLQQ